MECKSCKVSLSTQLGARPVAICAHTMCEKCYLSNPSCNVCGVDSKLLLEDVLCKELLNILKKLEDLEQKSRAFTPKFKCNDHYVGEFSFFCSIFHRLTCATCATECIRSHNFNVSGYTMADLKADIKQFTTCIDNTRNTCTELAASLCKLESSQARTEDIVCLLDRCFNLASNNRHPLQNVQFRPFYSVHSYHRTISGRSVIFVNPNDDLVRVLGGRRISLLYRASRDGDTRENFIDMVQSHGPILIAMKVKQSIIGAIVTYGWSKRGRCQKGDILFLMDEKLVILNRRNIQIQLLPETEVSKHTGVISALWSVGNQDLRIANQCLQKTSIMFPSYVEEFCFGGNREARLPFEKFMKPFTTDELECFSIS